MEGTCNQCAFPVQDPKSAEYSTGAKPLMHAAWKGYLQCVKELIAAGADVNQADDDGDTPLMWAAIGGQTECLQELIKSGAEVNLSSNSGCTALIHAATYGQEACITKLIKAGADVNMKDIEGFTSLIWAAYFANFKCIGYLLNAGVDVNETSKTGKTAVLVACMYAEYTCMYVIEGSGKAYVFEDHSIKKCIEALTKAGADVNMKDNAGYVPLIRVIHLDHEECVPLLLESGADVNTTDSKSGTSALMTAIGVNKRETIDQLLTAGADVNLVNNTGDTALTIAVVTGNVPVAKRLLKENCHINKTFGMVQNALSCYLKHSQPVDKDMSRLLFAAGEILDDDDSKETLESVLQLKEIRMQLKHVCREAIKKHLLKLEPHQHLFGRIPRLGLPKIIKTYLLYDESLEEKNMGQREDP